MRRILRMTAAATILLVAACGNDNKVGDESLLNFKDQANQRLGDTTTTAAPATTAPPTTVAGGKAAVGGATSTTARATTTTQQNTFDIAINSDAATSQFDPPSAQVYVGTIVRWVNKDTVPRSVEADAGQFKSAALPPGGTFTFRVSAPGRLNYHDGTRPYAVASLEVLR